MAKRRIFAGSQLRNLRDGRGLKQSEMAVLLGISVSYLSQLEHDDRPLTPTLIEILSRDFPLDWQEFEEDTTTRRFAALREAASDPLFSTPLSVDQLTRIAEQQPALADQFVALHSAYRRTGERLQIVDEALSSENAGGSRLPWEEVRDWFHMAGNYVDQLDRAAEELATRLMGKSISPSAENIESYLREALAISLIYSANAGLRQFDQEAGHLVIDQSQPAESQRFQLAHQLVALALLDDISAIVEAAGLRSASSRQLLFVGLANYAAGALLMPYNQFRLEARSLRHDIDRLRQVFGVSFEQACHRLSTLQRSGARGLPFFFCRVDMAGNITKRHSATRLQFARFGGACPLWIVHEAVAIPDRILVQLAETPDGVRYVSMAKGLVKPSGSYARAPRRYAVALGCEIEHARDFIYADGLDLTSPHAATPIGASCRICPRGDCDQRAFPPSDRPIIVDPDRRDVVPYRIA
ncbi:XRE family transcriptional regulator [Sphingorhabdus sp. IMCC26285]|uniref:XRE family transcriptional regulator n=1 Tax=Sphingorhabdus profundilacus TaxID=2509718 RepID=A0A6I4LVA2_9SPHN|nr:helix-turn-helix transcriptional regulator [Sphingorhabdus profundilacus]MVZ96961.1 XRE family transcriptional regulator [Sphingorhabdus profundilacus]